MKIELNARWIKGDSEIHLFRKMSDVLKITYDTLFIQETHQRRISYHSETINRAASRELSDLWIIAYSPRQKRIRTTFLQAKYHRKNILPDGIFKGDYFQYELLSQRPELLDGGTLNFPINVLSKSCCDSVGSYGIFYIDAYDSLNLAYCSASQLTLTDKPTTYGQFSVNLSFPTVQQSVSECCFFRCSELNYTYDIDIFTDHLLQLNIGEELCHNSEGLLFLKNFITRNFNMVDLTQLVNLINNLRDRNNNGDGDGDFFKSEGGNPNVLLINVDGRKDK